ncbi:MAG TPA: hypothetical protein VEI80_06510, partial [Candidatus Acidoferrales bacterium]|nr:hypothetical protein [Candidatus Acidoferrales bacterium]
FLLHSEPAHRFEPIRKLAQRLILRDFSRHEWAMLCAPQRRIILRLARYSRLPAERKPFEKSSGKAYIGKDLYQACYLR